MGTEKLFELFDNLKPDYETAKKSKWGFKTLILWGRKVPPCLCEDTPAKMLAGAGKPKERADFFAATMILTERSVHRNGRR